MTAEFILGKWKVQPADNCIVLGDQKVKLEPKAMELLLVLVNAKGEVVSRDEIFDQVWKHQIVADHVLYNLIANLRKALADDPQHPAFISTVPKKGYRLLQKAHWQNTEVAQASKPNRRPLILAIMISTIFALVIGIKYWPNIYGSNIISEHPADLNNEKSKEKNQKISIAVLPFDVFFDDPNTQYFADGLAEEIIHQLTAVPSFVVIARTSSFSFKGQQIDSKTLASKLNVEYLIEGSVRQENQQLRITVQLIKAKEGTHIWSKVFTRKTIEVLSLQQDISLSIVNSLLPDFGLISNDKLRKHPRSEEAYLHFLRGSAMAAKATPKFIKSAIFEYEQAIKLEPKYALAHVAIAVNTLVLHQHRALQAEEALTRAQSAINSALEIAPDMAEAYAAQGLLYTYSYQYNVAESAYQKALSLEPNLALAHHNYGFLLWIQDYQAKALKHFEKALQINPLSAITNFAVADALFNTGQLPSAKSQFQHCVALLPDYPTCRLGLANFYRFSSQQSLVTEQMEEAKQYLHPQNIYLVVGEIINKYWTGEYALALSELQKLNSSATAGYLDLQLKLLAYRQNNQHDTWTKKLLEYQQSGPRNLSLELVLGLDAYFNNDCETSLAYYEPILKNNYFLHGKFNVMAWGISHLSNMAYCYEQIGQLDKKREVLEMLKQEIREFDLGNFDIAGVALIKQKIHLLEAKDLSKAETSSANAPVIQWLKTVDPVFNVN